MEQEEEYIKRVESEAQRAEAASYLFNYTVQLLEKNGWYHGPFESDASWEKHNNWYWWRNDNLPEGERGTFTIEAALRCEHDKRFKK